MSIARAFCATASRCRWTACSSSASIWALDRASRGDDLFRHRAYLRERAAGEEDLRPLAGEGARDRAAYRPACSVDYRVLLFEEHGDHTACLVRERAPPGDSL